MGKKVKKRAKKVTVQVESVIPFSKQEQERLFQKLKDVLKTDRITVQFLLNPELLGGMTIKMNAELLDLSYVGRLHRFQNQMDGYHTKSLEMGKLADVFREQIHCFHPEPQLSEVGDVLSVSDGVARVSGLNTLMSGERVRFVSGAEGIALNLNPTTTDVMIFEQADRIREGDHAYATGQMNMIPVGFSLLGRVINPLGMPLDDKENLSQTEQRPIFMPAPGIVDRDSVKTPVHTGIKAIDSLVPIGRGQRELIIGDRQTGKTTLIIDTILSQKIANDKAARLQDKVFCIYVAIGQKQSTVRDMMRILQEQGAMDYTVIVSATAADSAVMQYLAPYAGCAIGEYFRDNGMHAIVFYDDLSKHAVAYREMSLLLKRPSGREAFPGDVFYLHSRLLERAAQLSDQKGGGSLTAIPVAETQEGDVSAYIPTNVISITDGQIFLESNLFHQGVRPAVNVGLSVSRVGSAAQSSIMKKMAGSLKLELSQYREVLSFSQLSSDLDTATQQLLNRGSRLTEIMKQIPYHPLTPAQELVSLFAGINGLLDGMALEEITPFLERLSEHCQLQGTELMAELNSGVWNETLNQKLKDFVSAFIERQRESQKTA
ncbi:MAG: F0F1 ATP synthase subunit alpha [Alphaproteobacteria bacterium]|nr:F0F1 ATP synthase subunit alpha [Alphaproteobacteria bacterium]